MTKQDRKQIWKSALEILKQTVAPSTFQPWITPLSPVEDKQENYKAEIFTLKSNQAFGVSHLNQKFLPEIQDAVKKAGSNLPVEIIFVPDDLKKKNRKKPDETIQKEQIENLKQMQSFCALNLKYRFENFVEGENSRVAFNASKQVANAPGQKFNPLFITGSVGIGKTHLMQAIGHEIIKKFPKMKIKYAKTEEFTNQLIDSCRNGVESYDKMKKFREQYRNIDVLLLDDVQFAEGKKRTEEEIFNTFDALFHQGKQIVFASDRPIETFEKTPDRLKSRYEWGLCVEILPPDFITRMQIIKNHSKRCNFEINDEVAKFLAENYYKNVRELEGAYNKISAYASIQGETLTVDSAKKILNFKNNKKNITIDDIIEVCAKYFQTTPQAVKSAQRSVEIKSARQLAIYFSRKILDVSFPFIAKNFNKNHTTIIYTYEKIMKDIELNLQLKQKINEIENLIYS